MIVDGKWADERLFCYDDMEGVQQELANGTELEWDGGYDACLGGIYGVYRTFWREGGHNPIALRFSVLLRNPGERRCPVFEPDTTAEVQFLLECPSNAVIHDYDGFRRWLDQAEGKVGNAVYPALMKAKIAKVNGKVFKGRLAEKMLEDQAKALDTLGKETNDD